MRVVVTGADGFIGTHLCRYLETKQVFVTKMKSDITNYPQVFNELKEIDFDTIIHLAGMSNIPQCEGRPDDAYRVNTVGTFHLLESLLRLNKKSRFVLASTGQVYESPQGEKTEAVIDEAWPLKPRNTYARTKLAAEKLVEEYYTSYSIGKAITFRLFNHTHSSQNGDFILPILYREMKSALVSSSVEPLSLAVGNIDVYRDFGLIADLCELFYKTLSSDFSSNYSVYNICSGHKRYIRNLANELALQLGIACNYVLDPQKVRANEPVVAVGSCKKATEVFNWEPSNLNDTEYIKRFLS